MSDHTIMVIWGMRTFLYSSSLYSCHLFLIPSASVRSIPLLSFIEPLRYRRILYRLSHQGGQSKGRTLFYSLNYTTVSSKLTLPLLYPLPQPGCWGIQILSLSLLVLGHQTIWGHVAPEDGGRGGSPVSEAAVTAAVLALKAW